MFYQIIVQILIILLLNTDTAERNFWNDFYQNRNKWNVSAAKNALTNDINNKPAPAALKATVSQVGKR